MGMPSLSPLSSLVLYYVGLVLRGLLGTLRIDDEMGR